MAVPTAAECKLNLSFDMVAKTMTVSVSSTVENDVVDNGLLYHIYYATLVDPLGDSVDIDEIYSEGAGDNVLSQTFDAPLDADGKVLNGAYSIFIPLCVVSDGTPSNYDDVDSSFTLSYTKPTVVLTATVDCITPSFVSTDTTDYRVIDPTSQGYITPTTVSYEHNLNYPATSNGYPTNATETDDLIITRGANEFYQGTQTAITTHLVSYLFVDGLVVTDTIDGDKETIVDCATLLCGITCGMNTLYTAMQAAKPINNTLYQTLEASFNLNSAKSMLAWMNITCGNSTEATNIIADIRASIGNCCDDCNPADGSPISGV
jgi:hypothetical protein